MLERHIAHVGIHRPDPLIVAADVVFDVTPDHPVHIGAGFGESARAALIARGFSEMQTLAETLGARSETLMGLSGLGDLILTCSSPQSRNFAHGLTLGQGKTPAPGKTVEGVATAQAVVQLARQHGLDMPITEVVAGLVSGKLSVQDGLQRLLARPLREE